MQNSAAEGILIVKVLPFCLYKEWPIEEKLSANPLFVRTCLRSSMACVSDRQGRRLEALEAYATCSWHPRFESKRAPG